MAAGAAWQGEFPLQASSFGSSFANDVDREAWEDWLRWDPGADTSSPGDGTVFSTSSKNDSPLQGPAIPVDTPLFDKVGDTFSTPLIMDEDGTNFGPEAVSENDAFLFGDSSIATASFDPQSMLPVEQLQPHMPRLDTHGAAWPVSSAADFDLSALTSDNGFSLPSAGTLSSNAPSLQHSSPPSSQNQSSSSTKSPEPPKKRAGRKRKAEVVAEEEVSKQENGDSPDDGEGPPVKKTSHNVIEKRYRNNLNDKIVELRNSVPSLRAMGRSSGADDSEDLEGLTPAHKLNKATVMAKATEYIRHLEKRNKTLCDEMSQLQARLCAVEATQTRINTMPTAGAARSRQVSTSSQIAPQNLLGLPQEQPRYAPQVTTQPYMQQQQQPTYARPPAAPVDARNQPQYVNARGRGGIMTKVMVAGMAGVMLMEGHEQHSGEDTRADMLFGAPTQLFKRGLSPTTSARELVRPLLKIALVVGAVVYLLSPLLSWTPRRKTKARSSSVRLPHAPSLASPIEVRRKAWQTAIQTVWVPKHFLLEVVAVTTKMISLSIRRLIGSDAYNAMTGNNKDDEIARIKCWDIAIDAQLAGGDAEVSYYRLLLTLMESGTLPDSPIRLMQKAVHFRLFFWEVANAGYGNLTGFKHFTEKVGKFYWDSARRLQKDLVDAKAHNRAVLDDEVDLLPDHLVSLIELECDEVLTEDLIQRAWNLAWNKPSAYRTTHNVARDAVVEDHAIRSPLDAVAAWYANITIDETLAETLNRRSSTLDTEFYINLAISVAPPASATHARALAAKAVLSNNNRENSIKAALKALPSFPSSIATTGTMNIVNYAPASPEVYTTLTLAKFLSLCSPNTTASTHNRAVDSIAALKLYPGDFSLLTAVATYRLLKSMSTEHHLPQQARHGLENLAGSLRVWTGSHVCKEAGLGRVECERIVELCIDIAKSAGGWNENENDSGYGSGEGSPVRTRSIAAFE